MMGRFWQIAMAGVIACCGSLAIAADTAGTPVGKKVDSFSLPDFHGKLHSLDDYKDNLVVVAFIGTECPFALPKCSCSTSNGSFAIGAASMTSTASKPAPVT
ncbi:MAG: redoxin domain-containing protein [Planctomycetia bacterium]|nr:redoxin domain-containing protein [Planctomycetia bacterium]